MINGKKCTIAWHIDDNKLSHVDPVLVMEILHEQKKKLTFTVTQEKGHDYLGMSIILTEKGTVKIDMRKQIMEIINSFSEKIDGVVTSPAGRNLFETGDDRIIRITKEQEE